MTADQLVVFAEEARAEAEAEAATRRPPGRRPLGDGKQPARRRPKRAV